ncbi:MAG: DUF2190 family protein [Kiritimatiellae bacterium]|nr:DUF2190 family protein [Kiritimatiellia bacterium]
MAIAKEKALVRLANKAATDLTDKEGYVAEYDSGLKLSGGTNALGIITEGGVAASDVAILGTFDGVVRAKASGTVAVGDKVVVDSAGKVKALPATAGTYTVVGVALQAGAADELVEIAPWQPTSVTVS